MDNYPQEGADDKFDNQKLKSLLFKLHHNIPLFWNEFTRNFLINHYILTTFFFGIIVYKSYDIIWELPI